MPGKSGDHETDEGPDNPHPDDQPQADQPEHDDAASRSHSWRTWTGTGRRVVIAVLCFRETS